MIGEEVIEDMSIDEIYGEVGEVLHRLRSIRNMVMRSMKGLGRSS